MSPRLDGVVGGTAAPGSSGRRPLRLLLVEDQENDAELLLAELDQLGYDVSVERVETREGMAAALEREWDLIVSDFSLPQFDGPSALELCRERNVELPFIIVSGTAAEEDAVESMRRGADDFIIKGRLARLGPAIVRSLRERGERKALKAAEGRLLHAQKIEAIGQLAGGVAHDFNNLLGVIVGYGEMLFKSMPPGGRDRERAAHILEAASRGASLTRQLLTFSRRQPMDARILELASAVENVETMLRRLIGEHIQVVTTSDGRRGRVKADPTQLEQVVMNLAINARDAMPSGGRLTFESSSIDLDAEQALAYPGTKPGPYVLLAVSDNGTGMSAETLSHIYEPFFTTKEAGRGTGLGLATVYGIVRQSGGHLAVSSEVGHGTTFKIYLPRVEDAVSASLAPQSGAQPTKGSETVLLIEDEAPLREVIVDQLLDCGYEVLTADDVEGALAAAERHAGPIHLVITDMVMPRISGREAVRTLRTRRPDIRVIYMSGYNDATTDLDGPTSPEESFLQKPFSLVTLTHRVREVLDAPARRPID